MHPCRIRRRPPIHQTGRPDRLFLSAFPFYPTLAHGARSVVSHLVQEESMPLIGPKEMFAAAYAGRYAVGAFNVNNM